jgi:OmpA-OmpF porin, OOP family
MNSTIKMLIVVVFLLCLPFTVTCQINVKKKIENQTNNRANQRTDQGISKGLDAVEGGIKGAFKKKDKTEQTQENEESKDNKDKDTAQDAKDQSSKQDQTSLQAFSKYDFVPGENIILFDDFSQDAVGDFPALWTANTAGEINTLNIGSGNWFNLNSGEGTYSLLKNIDFPTNFIIEFDIVPKKTGGRIAAELVLYGEIKPLELDPDGFPGASGVKIDMEKENWIAIGYKKGSPQVRADSKVNPVEAEKINHVIIWVQNRRLRIYLKSAKVLDMPTLLFEGTKLNRLNFKLYRGASCGSYISNLRITDAAPDMRSKLLTEGKLVSYGIYFDVNKDVVKSESYGTLKGIATVLTENPDVRIKIVGHTDADGADASNLDLSKRRGESVKQELVKTFGIDASRIESGGMGESQPVAPNDTPANKALNRRVEFIKL